MRLLRRNDGAWSSQGMLGLHRFGDGLGGGILRSARSASVKLADRRRGACLALVRVLPAGVGADPCLSLDGLYRPSIGQANKLYSLVGRVRLLPTVMVAEGRCGRGSWGWVPALQRCWGSPPRSGRRSGPDARKPVGGRRWRGTTRIAAELLARDLTALGGRPGPIVADRANCIDMCVVIGTIASPVVQRLAREGGWTCRRSRAAGNAMSAGVRVAGRRYLLIAGSDARGAAYGVTDLSRALGVSPWEWWADVTPRRRDRIVVSDRTFVSRAPSVKYRGIFLNDEDWGLEPWRPRPSTGKGQYRAEDLSACLRTDVAVEGQYAVACDALRFDALLW